MTPAPRPREGRRQLPPLAAALLAVFLLILAGCTGTDPAGWPDDEAGPLVAEVAEPTTPPDESGLEPTAGDNPVALPPDGGVSTDATSRPGDPARVVIDTIGVDADLVRLGLDERNHMEVPAFGLAGWYEKGPKPGDPGPSVIAAHVDSRSGPDVFYRLHELRPGDEVRVVYDDGREVVFVVDDDPVQTPKDELPGDDIWPVTNERLLTLITCGGTFDRSIGHYDDNVIVYTKPADGET